MTKTLTMATLFTLKRTAAARWSRSSRCGTAPAFAQSAGAPYAAAARQPGGDPPGRVARLNLSGAVTTEPAGTDTWSYAAVNRPLTTGDQLWNDAGARSELHIGSTAVRLGESTSLSVLSLDDTTTQLKVPAPYRRTCAICRPADRTKSTRLTSRSASRPGDYRVDVAPNGASTTVTVRSGGATVYGSNGQYPLSPGQQVVFTGTDLQVAQQSAAQPRPARPVGRQPRRGRGALGIGPLCVPRHPRLWDLDANGTWRETGLGAERHAGRLGAVSRRPLDLAGTVGLDVGRRRAVGFRAVSLRPLGTRGR